MSNVINFPSQKDLKKYVDDNAMTFLGLAAYRMQSEIKSDNRIGTLSRAFQNAVEIEDATFAGWSLLNVINIIAREALDDERKSSTS